jgi:hypothetical protein
MIICPSCKNQEPTGALFCSECGAQLLNVDGLSTQKITLGTSDMKTTPVPDYGVKARQDTRVSLHLLESGQIISVPDRNEFTLGRISEKQPIMPDIDLSDYDAFDHGVSRLHAVIRLTDGEATVMDLGSSNGSYLNGVRLIPNTESPLQQDDVLSLGKLKMQIFFTTK